MLEHPSSLVHTKSTTVVYLVGLEVHTLGAAAAMRRAHGGAILSRAGSHAQLS